jgi:hypothetical protein
MNKKILIFLMIAANAFAFELTETITKEVKTLTCPATSSSNVQGIESLSATVEAEKLGDTFHISPYPVFKISGVYISGKVLCQSGSKAPCFAVGNTDMSGRITRSSDFIWLRLPVRDAVVEFKCDLTLL